MVSGTSKRTRSDRVAALRLPPTRWARLLAFVQRADVLLRLGLAAVAALVIWLLTGAWAPPFAFRSGYIPPRDIVARTMFADPERTDALQKQKRSETILVYEHNPGALIELRKALKDRVIQVVQPESYDQVDMEAWREFWPSAEQRSGFAADRAWQQLRDGLSSDQALDQFDQAIQSAMAQYERYGLLQNLQHKLEEGSHTTLLVHPQGNEDLAVPVSVNNVRITEAASELRDKLLRELQEVDLPESQIGTFAHLAYNWLRQKLPTTLSLNEEASERARQQAVATVEPAMFRPGDKLAEGGQPLVLQHIKLLQDEHRTLTEDMTPSEILGHTLADLGMFVALYILCGVYIYFHQPRILDDLRQFSTMLALVVVTVALCWVAARDAWRAEIVPLLLFGMTVAIAYERELALLLSAAVALVIALSLGHGLPEFVILVAAVAAAILLLTRIRSRTKLTYVGFCAGVVATLTTIGVGTLAGQTFGATRLAASLPQTQEIVEAGSFATNLLWGAAWYGTCSLIAGLLMTALLPFIERLFDVQTDISLLELGDAAHPLLQELARRAPGTYNHSINVASLGEAAAEAIGANGLLVRVGAYFHDIGKMLKPGYFVENQGRDANRHASLLPAMSTLVIIAHVKDGADLARQHHLPQSMIDFIEQHHGTTLVEYFYRQATKRLEGDPEGGEVDETNFRYPGPKPQTPEAAVLMLSDAVESASRTLVDPAPSRIEGLVEDMAMKRLLDGQFDDCGLTLQQLHIIQESLVKSLTAVYHGRVKYTEQTA